MPTKKPKTKPALKTSFYLYRWSNGFTTFLVANSPEEAIEKIRKNREVACPSEIHEEKISKRKLKQASQEFILTVGAQDTSDDDLPEMEWN